MAKRTKTKTTSDDQSTLATLAEDASALMAATADVAGEKVAEARKRLSGALENVREMANCVGDKASEYAEATDDVVREHRYQAIGIAFGVGVLIGGLLLRRNGSRNRD